MRNRNANSSIKETRRFLKPSVTKLEKQERLGKTFKVHEEYGRKWKEDTHSYRAQKEIINYIKYT